MRYERLDPLNLDAERLQENTVAVVGLGATGSHMAENLARLGADIVLIDRDWLEPQNLSTSALYTEEQVEKRLPKTVAAQEKLADINSEISIRSHLEDLNADTCTDLLAHVDLILDGTDNLETRFLLNEYSVKTGTPWVHVSALGYAGEVMPIVPETTACFHCLFADKDGAALETCETAGILKETAATAANLATRTAFSLLAGEDGAGLTRFNLKNQQMRTLSVEQRDDCRVCTKQDYPYLKREQGSVTTVLCGEHKYQIRPREENRLDLATRADRLRERGAISVNDHLLRFESDDARFTLFKSGRAIITAESEAEAKSVYTRLIGN